MGPFIEERKRLQAEHPHGWADKPVRALCGGTILLSLTGQNDLLQWVLDSDCEDEKTTERIIFRLLTLNFAAIHTTALVRFF